MPAQHLALAKYWQRGAAYGAQNHRFDSKGIHKTNHL